MVPALAQSAYLPAAGELNITPGYSFASYDVFRVGTTRVKPLRANNASFDQHAGYLSGEYGLSENFALDVTVGYTRASRKILEYARSPNRHLALVVT